MSDTTAPATTSINPNTPVEGEGKVESRSNSALDWDSVEDATIKTPPAKRAAEPKETPAKAPAKNEATSPKVEPKAKPEAKDGEQAKDGKEPAEKKDGEQKPAAKPRTLKVKNGDQVVDLSSEALVTVTIDGKKEEMKLGEALNLVSGNVHLDRKAKDFIAKEKEFSVKEQEHRSSVEDLNKMITDLQERATKNPEDGLDFLAELTGQDPVELKEKTIRAQFEAMKPLFEMTEQEREQWFREQRVTWRERKLEVKDKQSQLEGQKAKAAQAATETKQRYGMSDDEYNDALETAREYVGSVDKSKLDQITPDVVARTHRTIMAREVIADVAPHLESREDYASIVRDVVDDLCKHPSLNREKLGKLLKDVWGEDDADLRRLGSKAAKNAAADGETPKARPAHSSRKEVLTLNDLD